MEESDIIEIFWENLPPIEGDEETRWVDKTLLEEFYEHGFVDRKRVPVHAWTKAFEKFPQEEDQIFLQRKDLTKISSLLYQGPIKKPFNPFRLKDGLRPITWLNEMYQKVLRFETILTLSQWNQVIQNDLKKSFFKEGQFVFDRYSKEFLQDLLEQKASPLRKLEIWIHQGPPKTRVPTEVPVKKAPQPIPTRDSFQKAPEEPKKMKAIEKLYYQEGREGPPVDDTETLNILDELEKLGGDDDSELP